jgi:tryptophan-rich sensory protein
MKFYKGLLLFLLINFSALAIGSWIMNDGPRTEWYINLNQAPWSPPGWVFGMAWSSIMILFSVYMTFLIQVNRSKKVILLFSIQFALNVFWNYFFFQSALGSFRVAQYHHSNALDVLFFGSIQTLPSK